MQCTSPYHLYVLYASINLRTMLTQEDMQTIISYACTQFYSPPGAVVKLNLVETDIHLRPELALIMTGLSCSGKHKITDYTHTVVNVWQIWQLKNTVLRCVYVCVCVCVCMHVCMCVCVCMQMCACVCDMVCVCIQM